MAQHPTGAIPPPHTGFLQPLAKPPVPTESIHVISKSQGDGMPGWDRVLQLHSRGLPLTKRDSFAGGAVSKVTNRNISRHIQYIKPQSVSPLIGNKCKCLVMAGLGAMKNTSGWLVFLPTICSRNQRRECMRACAPEEGGSGRRRSGRGWLEGRRSVLEGGFGPELSPAHRDLQVLHLCLVLCSPPR